MRNQVHRRNRALRVPAQEQGLRKFITSAADFHQKVAGQPHQSGIIMEWARGAFQRVRVEIIIVGMQVVDQIASGNRRGGIQRVGHPFCFGLDAADRVAPGIARHVILDNFRRAVSRVGIIDDVFNVAVALPLHRIQRVAQVLFAVVSTGHNTDFWESGHFHQAGSQFKP